MGGKERDAKGIKKNSASGQKTGTEPSNKLLREVGVFRRKAKRNIRKKLEFSRPIEGYRPWWRTGKIKKSGEK